MESTIRELEKLGIFTKYNIASYTVNGYVVESDIEKAGCPANVISDLINDAFITGYTSGYTYIQNGIKELIDI